MGGDRYDNDRVVLDSTINPEWFASHAKFWEIFSLLKGNLCEKQSHKINLVSLSCSRRVLPWKLIGWAYLGSTAHRLAKPCRPTDFWQFLADDSYPVGKIITIYSPSESRRVLERVGRCTGACSGMQDGAGAVSYTHLTLPTIYSV